MRTNLSVALPNLVAIADLTGTQLRHPVDGFLVIPGLNLIDAKDMA